MGGRVITHCEGRGCNKWLRNLDSNQDYLIQSQACCHYTIPQRLIYSIGAAACGCQTARCISNVWSGAGLL